MTATQQFVERLASLKPGDFGLLRKHANIAIDESLAGFDLFTGLWWPLRQQNQKAPRREVAWLAAKLYAFRPIPQQEGATLAWQLGSIGPPDQARQRRFDAMLSLPLRQLEPALQWALALVADDAGKLDWVRLIDHLSIWERQETRLKWANEYLHRPQ